MKTKLLLTCALCVPTILCAEEVTLDTLVRAETDHMFRVNMAANDIEIGEFTHFRQPIAAEDPQPVIRANQDTLYSAVVLDLSEPAEIILPEIDGRYQSMLVISQDHYMLAEATPGTYPLTEEKVGSRFAMVLFRTFVNANDPDDLAATHAAQDGIKLIGGAAGPFEAPDWDLDSLAVARKALNDLASAISFDASKAFGTKEKVTPLDHLVGAISAWAGLPPSAAMYEVDSVPENDGEAQYAVTVRDVPVDAFWSVTVYNADGYLEPNDLGVNSYNNVSATPNDDGSYTLYFGGCEDGRINCIPITPDWNHSIRLYEPRAEVLDGRWTFPAFERVN
ncbi:DUF1214 domain-containing protein [Aliiruegeria sabulilitoris]|uniref:DUF1214 domain-containing protein n=1 Tax=Aliiruegeria sabulilitoris TaxID=1510458 RepID=UPI0008356E63|nr:DUF1214 domain-containing protein [Aliiruegeria sabulilitoris]NDR58678.1 DUF1214 domain-containing protein [Pseudoruegeria sp. M32A2M]